MDGQELGWMWDGCHRHRGGLGSVHSYRIDSSAGCKHLGCRENLEWISRSGACVRNAQESK